MKYIEAPNECDLTGKVSVFLAGGITGCPDWQSELVSKLEGIDDGYQRDTLIFNPRRAKWDMKQGDAAAQIAWEYKYLLMASAVSFWFPAETLCPIVLFELGRWSYAGTPIFVGVDPKYPRRFDVEVQMRLVRPTLRIVYSLSDLAEQIETWVRWGIG